MDPWGWKYKLIIGVPQHNWLHWPVVGMSGRSQSRDDCVFAELIIHYFQDFIWINKQKVHDNYQEKYLYCFNFQWIKLCNYCAWQNHRIPLFTRFLSTLLSNHLKNIINENTTHEKNRINCCHGIGDNYLCIRSGI